jgi:hypothetical protein
MRKKFADTHLFSVMCLEWSSDIRNPVPRLLGNFKFRIPPLKGDQIRIPKEDGGTDHLEVLHTRHSVVNEEFHQKYPHNADLFTFSTLVVKHLFELEFDPERGTDFDIDHEHEEIMEERWLRGQSGG